MKWVNQPIQLKRIKSSFKAGYLEKTKNNKIEYNVNTNHPLYETLKK